MIKMSYTRINSKIRHVKLSVQGGQLIMNGQVYNYGDSYEIDYDNNLSINDKTYSLDNPNALKDMPENVKKIFLQHCSDKAKESRIYQDYATGLLKDAKIDISSQSPPIKTLMLNSADNLIKLNKFFIKQNNHQWLSELSSFPQDRLEILLQKSSDTTQLLTGLKERGYPPLATIKNIDKDYLILMLEKSYDISGLLRDSADIYKDLLSVILKIDLTNLQFILKNRYDTTKLMDTLKNLGFNDPLTKLLSIKSEYRELIYNKRYDAIQFIEFFQKIYPKLNPLNLLLSLPTDRLTIFFDKRYDATQIMTALHDQELNPLTKLQDLNTDDLTTIFNNCLEYVNRIRRGIDILDEFRYKPVRANNIISPKLSQLIISQAGLSNNRDKVKEFKIDLPLDLLDHNCQVMTIPVRLDGELFDYLDLSKLPEDKDGYRTNPNSGDKFCLHDIQPAMDVQKRLDKLFDAAFDKSQESNKTFRFR
jgi:hypothetical protein